MKTSIKLAAVLITFGFAFNAAAQDDDIYYSPKDPKPAKKQ